MKKFAGNNVEDQLGWIESEDTTFWVTCSCGHKIEDVISDWEIVRCPKCGKGYIGEFVVWQYDADETE